MDLFGPDHSCLGCGQVHQGARVVALVDGTQVSSYSEAWRVECEARGILSIRGMEKRQQNLANIERFRGKVAADQLRDSMLIIWNDAQARKLSAA